MPLIIPTTSNTLLELRGLKLATGTASSEPSRGGGKIISLVLLVTFFLTFIYDLPYPERLLAYILFGFHFLGKLLLSCTDACVYLHEEFCISPC